MSSGSERKPGGEYSRPRCCPTARRWSWARQALPRGTAGIGSTGACGPAQGHGRSGRRPGGGARRCRAWHRRQLIGVAAPRSHPARVRTPRYQRHSSAYRWRCCHRSRRDGCAGIRHRQPRGVAGAPDLHTAAHEAAHVVQQQAGVQLKGGVGAVGDSYELHADAVADAVVQGKSAEGLLDQMAPSHATGGASLDFHGHETT
jgi:hypothetical protein